METTHITKAHNVNLLLYHLVCPVKYRRKIFQHEILDVSIREICLHEIQEQPYEITFHEIWVDLDHVHFLLQTLPTVSPKNMVQTIKSITARFLRKEHGELLKKYLWKPVFWIDRYYISTVWAHANANTIENYIKNQWKSQEFKRLYVSEEQMQLVL